MSAPVRWLPRPGLDLLLERLVRETELVAPVRVEGDILFLPVAAESEVCADYVNSLAPPREYFLPTPERLLEYTIRHGTPSLEPDAPGPAPRERVLFGIRSCDVAGLAYLERYFSGAMFGRPDLADAPFMRRRASTTLISVVCLRPGPTCMCVCCDGGPALEAGYDWQLTDLDDGWLVEIGSPKGERLAARQRELLSEPPADAVERKRARVAGVVANFGSFGGHRVPTMAATRMVSSGRAGEAFWKGVGERCFECGGCAYVCPTCWCFNVADVQAVGEADFDASPEGFGFETGTPAAAPDGRWSRVRLRDNCLLPGFVRQAGGSYPRWTCGERCITRFFHKLSQQFQERMQAPGCTGCGRCIQTCLGEEGVDRIAEGLRNALTGTSGAHRGTRVAAAADAAGDGRGSR